MLTCPRPFAMSRSTPVLAVLILLLVACTQQPTAALDGRTFLSTGVTVDGEPFELVDGTSIQLMFRDGGELGASAGCNSIGGTYRIEGGTLVFSGGGMTEMGCDPERHAQDDWLVDLLGSRPSIDLAGDDLTLTSGSTVVRLLDREVAQPDLELLGPVWTVDSIITGDAVASTPGGAIATLRFFADGRVDVASGCNTGGGRYEVNGSVIQFNGLVTTDMACTDGRGDLEAAVMAVLNGGPLTAAIDADKLTLMAGPNGLGLIGS